MESLLSLAFDNISSRETTKIRKGLRQIEGLLAQICLSKAATSRGASPRKRGADGGGGEAKGLRELRDDAAFREFFRLQDGFQCNVASRLLSTLERLLSLPPSATHDSTMHSALDLLLGTLLLHPPSRSLFAREVHLTILLDLLDAGNPPLLQSQALLVLLAALLDCPRIARAFEELDGLETVASLYRGRGTSREVRGRAGEVLGFYLMPEEPAKVAASAPNSVVIQRQGRNGGERELDKVEQLARHARTHSGDSNGGGGGMEEAGERGTRTMEEKQRLLGRLMGDVEGLVQGLSRISPEVGRMGS